MSIKIKHNNYMNSLFADEEYKKCFAIEYAESCKKAKVLDENNAGQGYNTCDNEKWNSQTRHNASNICKEKINKMSIFQYPRFK